MSSSNNILIVMQCLTCLEDDCAMIFCWYLVDMGLLTYDIYFIGWFMLVCGLWPHLCPRPEVPESFGELHLALSFFAAEQHQLGWLFDS